MQTPPPHVDCLYLRRGGSLDRREVTLANREVVLDDPTKRRKRQQHRDLPCSFRTTNVEEQTALLYRQVKMIWTAEAAQRLEIVVLEQIVYGDGTLVLDVRAAADNRVLIKRDVGDALRLVGHRAGPD